MRFRDGQKVTLLANEEDAVVLEYKGDDTYVVQVAPHEDGDDGLREVTSDQIKAKRENRQQITTHKGGYTLVWRISKDREGVDVDVSKDGKVIIEWCYPRVRGYKSLRACALLWEDQAILEAKTKKVE